MVVMARAAQAVMLLCAACAGPDGEVQQEVRSCETAKGMPSNGPWVLDLVIVTDGSTRAALLRDDMLLGLTPAPGLLDLRVASATADGALLDTVERLVAAERFPRAESVLGIVVISEIEDTSTVVPEDLAARLRASTRRVHVEVAAPPDGRLARFGGALLPFGSVDDIGEVSSLGEVVFPGELAIYFSPCLLVAARDTSPEPGLQLDCSVLDERWFEEPHVRVVPACGEGNTGPRPCWRMSIDPKACSLAEGNMRLHVEREQPAPRWVWTTVRCGC